MNKNPEADVRNLINANNKNERTSILKVKNFFYYVDFILEGRKGVTTGTWTLILPNGEERVLLKPQLLISKAEIRALSALRGLYLSLATIAYLVGVALGYILYATFGLFIYVYLFVYPFIEMANLILKVRT